MEQENFNAWLHGLYVHNAVAVSLANSFGGGRKVKYIERPIPLKSKGNMEERLKAEFGAFADRLKEKLCS